MEKRWLVTPWNKNNRYAYSGLKHQRVFKTERGAENYLKKHKDLMWSYNLVVRPIDW